MAELRAWFCRSHTVGLHSELQKEGEKGNGWWGMMPFDGAGRHLYLQAAIYL